MHVLMVSLDTTILTQEIGDTRARHEAYAAQAGGRISMVICNRQPDLGAYHSERVTARPTGSRSYLHYLRDGCQLGAQFHQERPIDLVTSQDPFLTALVGLRLRRRLRVPLIIQDHSSFLSSPYFTAERRRNIALKLLARFTLPRADAVRVVNRRERLACIRLGVEASRVCVVPVATDLSRFLEPAPPSALEAWRAKLDLRSETPTVLWVGRPVAFKNLPLLLHAFQFVVREMPEARLILVGDMRGTNITGQAAARGLTEVVRFPGPVAHTDLPPLYQLATVYALSSNYEGLARVLIEAGAAGLPVVSTESEGTRDVIVHNLTGVLVPVGDAGALARALVELLRDPERRRGISDKARQHILNAYDEHTLMRRWVRMWQHVTTGEAPCES